MISTCKREYARITGADGGLNLKQQKALEGLLKIFCDKPGAYFLRVPPLGAQSPKISTSLMALKKIGFCTCAHITRHKKYDYPFGKLDTKVVIGKTRVGGKVFAFN